MSRGRGHGVPECVIDGCHGSVHGHGWCKKHYFRWAKHGDPLREPPTAVERYYAGFTPAAPSKCWPWTGTGSQDGYGKIQINGRTMRPTRYGWELRHGSPPAGLICHTCDNPPCQNPGHWYLGTPKDNSLDRVTRGRHTSAVLTPDDIREIRRLSAAGQMNIELAEQFGVRQAQISKIVNRRQWAWVD